MAFRMNYAQNRNDVLVNQEDDSIGEAVGKHPPHGVSAMSNGINERIQRQQCHGLADFMDELSGESRLARTKVWLLQCRTRLEDGPEAGNS